MPEPQSDEARSWRSHPCGISRFFAFESLLVLITLNSGSWYSEPYRARKIVSWVFFSLSIYLAAHGIFLLVKLGKLIGDLENTSRLVKSGRCSLIRHPLYASLVYLGFGAYLKRDTLLTTFLVAGNTVALFITAKVEEGEIMAKFGQEYRDYMKTTKRFVPFLF